MSLDYGEQYVAHDRVSGAIDVSANEGVTTDGDGGYQFDWDAIPTVDATDIPDSYTAFYDAESFHVVSDVTVARPMEQQYRINGDTYTFKKVESELRKAAWTFDNNPHPLGHPETGVVKATDDIHGFWKNVRYEDDEGIVADLYLPSNDDEALEYVSDHGDVSIGFYNRLKQTDESGVDAIQTDIVGDHIASVTHGRCSGEDGCGLNADGQNTAVVADAMTGDASSHVHNGTWYAIRPSENSDGEWKYPIENCSDVDDAWKLRANGDYGISQSELEDRIKGRARDLSCDVPSEGDDPSEPNDSADFYSDLRMTETDSQTNDCSCSGDGDGTIKLGDALTGMSVDAVAERNDSVAELLEEKERLESDASDLRERLESVREALDADEDTDLADEVEAISERLSDAEAELEEKRRGEFEALVDDITSMSEYTEDDFDFEEDSIEDLRDKKETIDMAVSEPTTANPGTSTDSGETTEVDETVLYDEQY